MFGWTVNASEQYTHWGVDGDDFGGMTAMSGDEAQETPPRWMPYFAVPDVETTAATALSARGDQLMPPRRLPGGRWIAVLRDPQEAAFGIHTP